MAAAPVTSPAVTTVGTVTRLRLTGPTLSAPVLDALLDAVRAAEHGDGRALLLESGADAFCTGYDLTGVGTREAPADTAEVGAALWQLLDAMSTSSLITAALVDGPVTGGGIGLVSACDLVFATPRASFRVTEPLLGLAPAVIMPFVLARTGEQALLRLALLGESLDRDGAVAAGLVDRAVGDAGTAAGVLGRAGRRVPRRAVADLKSCRRLARPLPAGYLPHAQDVVGAALADPSVRARIVAATS